jgi:hypothetical protein
LLKSAPPLIALPGISPRIGDGEKVACRNVGAFLRR